MTLEKNLFVTDIQDNQEVKGLFLVKMARLSETKAGKPFLTLELMDRTGEILGRVWDNAERLASVCPGGSVVMISGRAQSYKGVLQLSVNGVEGIIVEGADWGLFIPATSADIEVMAAELIALIKKIEDKDIRRLLQAIVKDQPLWAAFRTAPAAKTMHHAYIGGLLEHTLGLCRLACSVCVLYPALNKSLLLAGAILHDLGKIKEFSFDVPPFDYSEQGRLLGHMTIALDIIQQKLSGLRDFPERTATMIKHLVVSHHGSHEFGSPVLPMIREAFVLNFLDDLDAKMNYLDRLSSQTPVGEYQFTEYQRNMARFLFVTGHPAQSDERSESETVQTEEGQRQPSLWG
ncbi:MAG: HD domain-containing protein [Proteobacteria bacterium]|nr:HD domain-containing protein [Desulfobulbaceae bacterium]MBU4153613.1 HD domain-containing protein [Pseudomonadota bacterium]